ncbi:BCD family MFS transporter [Anaerolineae bacterium CFX9]|jgi:BCD family chlorophyll transporter-like MFS transporter|nr:BCD family MFS transporter [Anaerolineae bacterium CFX9]
MSETHTAPDAASQTGLSTGRNLKIGLFHLGSGMADVITTGIWNRIMISDLGFSATPIGLLVALRYFLAPLGVWAGRQSDQRQLGGYRRLVWIWGGRLLMAISIALLGITTASLVEGNPADALHWAVIAISLLMFSLGNAFSGSTFLALIYDRSREEQRGRAVGIVWTFLLLGFTVGGILFGVLLPSSEGAAETAAQTGIGFTSQTVLTLFVVAAGVLALLWFVSLVGEEKRHSRAASKQEEREAQSSSLRADLRLAWSNRQTRFFFWFLSLSMLFAFSQDLILEPFAGDVFGMEARHTTRFAAYWGSMAILGTIVFLFLGRRYKRLTNTVMSTIGVSVLILTFALFALSSFAEIRGLVTPGLITLGIGLGIWNVGALGLMMEMSPFGKAGTFLGFWTLVVTLSRGIGVSGGGIVRDIALGLSGNDNFAYGLAFALGVIGLSISLWALRHVNVAQFRQSYERQPADAQTVFAGGMD